MWRDLARTRFCKISMGLIWLDRGIFGKNLLHAATRGEIWQDLEIFDKIRPDAIRVGKIRRNSAQFGNIWRALSHTIY